MPLFSHSRFVIVVGGVALELSKQNNNKQIETETMSTIGAAACILYVCEWLTSMMSIFEIDYDKTKKKFDVYTYILQFCRGT